MTERINENGIREVLCKEDGKWYADTIYENGQRYLLDERPDRFHYYPVDDTTDRNIFMRELIEQEAADLFQMKGEMRNG